MGRPAKTEEQYLSEMPRKQGPFTIGRMCPERNTHGLVQFFVICTVCGDDRRTVTVNQWIRGAVKCKCQLKKLSKYKRKKDLLTHNNLTMGVSEWAQHTQQHYHSIYRRLKARSAAHPMSDEEVIFGKGKGQPYQEKPMVDSVRIQRAVEEIRRSLHATLQPLLNRAIENTLDDTLPKVINQLIVDVKATTEHRVFTEQATALAPTNLLPCTSDPTMFWDPAPLPQDDDMFYRDATVRQAREYYGDDSVIPMLECPGIYAEQDMIYTGEIILPKPKGIRLLDRDPDAPSIFGQQMEDIDHPDWWTPHPEHHHKFLGIPEWPRMKPLHPLPENFPPQEDTIPFSDAEYDYLLSAPWLQGTRLQDMEIFECMPYPRTMHDRIVMYQHSYQYAVKDFSGNQIDFSKQRPWIRNKYLLRYDLRKAYEAFNPYDNEHSYWLTTGPEQDFSECSDHRLLTNYLQARLMVHWLECDYYSLYQNDPRFPPKEPGQLPEGEALERMLKVFSDLRYSARETERKFYHYFATDMNMPSRNLVNKLTFDEDKEKLLPKRD